MSQPRIGIVGAGPGGLSLARFLTEAGHADITLIERARQAGGKSYTVPHQGVAHEMGTCYLTTGYTHIKKWMEMAGIGEYILQKQVVELEGDKVQDYKEYVLGEGGMVHAAAQVASYVNHWRKFHDWEMRGCPPDEEGTNGRTMLEEVSEPFGKWLADRDLDVLYRFALRALTVMGYGARDKTPALYGLRWNVPSLLWSAVTVHVVEPTSGWQPLWVSMANDLDVRFGHTITGVDRSGPGYRVITDHGDLQFDHLVLTCPLDEAAAWFPFTDEEKANLPVSTDTLAWHELVTTLVHATGWYKDSDTRAWEPRARDHAALGQCRIVGARRTGDKSPVAKARSKTRPDVYVCYQYGDKRLSDAQIQDRLRSDIEGEGGRIQEILAFRRWRYCPKYTPDAIRSGAVGRAERQQGQNNLWITGASMSHEAIDNIVDYNERLSRRMDLAFKGEDFSSEDMFQAQGARYRFNTDLM